MKIVSVVGLLLLTSPAWGGISVQGSSRAVSAYILGDESPVPPPSPAFVSHDVGAYDKTAEAHIRNSLGDHSDVTSSQRSFVGSNFVTARGTFLASSSDDLLTFSNTFDASFRVTEPTTYRLAMTLSFDWSPTSTATPLTVRLRDASRASDLVLQEYAHVDLFWPVSLKRSGTLAPGDYDLHFDLHDTVTLVHNTGAYRLDFAIGDRGGPTAVPIPPAGWAGLMMLIALAAWKWRAARRVSRAA